MGAVARQCVGKTTEGEECWFWPGPRIYSYCRFLAATMPKMHVLLVHAALCVHTAQSLPLGRAKGNASLSNGNCPPHNYGQAKC